MPDSKERALPDPVREVEVFHRLRREKSVLPKRGKRILLTIMSVLMVPVLSIIWVFGVLMSDAVGRRAPTRDLIEKVSFSGGFRLPERVQLAEGARVKSNPHKINRLDGEIARLGPVVNVDEVNCASTADWGKKRSGRFITCRMNVDYEFERQSVQIVWYRQKGRWRLDDFIMTQTERTLSPPAP